MRIAISFLGSLLLFTGAAIADDEDAHVVEKKRVVVRVNVQGDDTDYEYVHVDHDDGEPVVVDSFLVERGYLGISLLELTPELRRHFGAAADAGVMISRVDRDGPAFEAGLRAGDIIQAIDGQPLSTTAEVVETVSAGRGGREIELDIVRDGRELSLRAMPETRQRRQVDLGGLIVAPGVRVVPRDVDWHSGNAPRIELDPEVMKQALDRMREHLARRGMRARLEVRIQELEERLKELEVELEELEESPG